MTSARVPAARVPLAVDPEQQGPAPAVAGLTRREREILTRIVAGRTYGVIARELVTSEKTVGAPLERAAQDGDRQPGPAGSAGPPPVPGSGSRR